MKSFMFLFILLATACTSPKKEAELEGTYVASYEHEFGRSTDTLIVKRASSGNEAYHIIRHTGLIKKLDGKEFPKELFINDWVLNFDINKNTLTEQREGKILVWDSKNLTLQLGDRSYKKQ